MSTRLLGLLTTTAAASVALTAGIAAAAAAAAAPPPAPDPAPPVVAAQPQPAAPPAAQDPPAQSAPPPAADGGDSAADTGTDAKAAEECADAECEIKVHDDQTIKFDKKYNLDPMHVGIDGNLVTLSSHGRNGTMVSTMNATRSGSSVTNNGITFRPKLERDGTISLKISRD